jgi:hypothetical protein
MATQKRAFTSRDQSELVNEAIRLYLDRSRMIEDHDGPRAGGRGGSFRRRMESFFAKHAVPDTR